MAAELAQPPSRVEHLTCKCRVPEGLEVAKGIEWKYEHCGIPASSAAHNGLKRLAEPKSLLRVFSHKDEQIVNVQHTLSWRRDAF